MELLRVMLMMLRSKAAAFMHEEKGAVDIVAIVVMIGIAVLLAVIFKDQITALLESLFATITGNAQSAVGG